MGSFSCEAELVKARLLKQPPDQSSATDSIEKRLKLSNLTLAAKLVRSLTLLYLGFVSNVDRFFFSHPIAPSCGSRRLAP